MVSLIFPSLKDKIKMFEEESKKQESRRAGTSVFVKRRELEKMVETETRKRNQSFWKIWTSDKSIISLLSVWQNNKN